MWGKDDGRNDPSAQLKKIPAGMGLSINERIVEVMRTHVKILFPPILLAVATIAASIAAAVLLPRLPDQAEKWLQTTPGVNFFPLPVWILVIGLIASLPRLGWVLLKWYKQVYVITNFRIIYIEGIIWTRTKETPVNRVGQVSVESGLLDKIFRCGTIRISVSANVGVGGGFPSDSDIRLRDVPHVSRVHGELNNLIAAAHSGGGYGANQQWAEPSPQQAASPPTNSTGGDPQWAQQAGQQAVGPDWTRGLPGA